MAIINFREEESYISECDFTRASASPAAQECLKGAGG